jgi:hypothetical protein
MYTLYGSRGSGSAVVEIALRVAGLPYTVVRASAWEPDFALAELEKANPLKHLQELGSLCGLIPRRAILIREPRGGARFLRRRGREVSVSKSALAIAIVCTGCAGSSGPSPETLGATIRDVGLRCREVASAEAIAERQGTWRVTCSDALVYAATLAENGELCIEAIIAGGFSGDLAPTPPEPRCAPLSDTQ